MNLTRSRACCKRVLYLGKVGNVVLTAVKRDGQVTSFLDQEAGFLNALWIGNVSRHVPYYKASDLNLDSASIYRMIEMEFKNVIITGTLLLFVSA